MWPARFKRTALTLFPALKWNSSPIWRMDTAWCRTVGGVCMLNKWTEWCNYHYLDLFQQGPEVVWPRWYFTAEYLWRTFPTVEGAIINIGLIREGKENAPDFVLINGYWHYIVLKLQRLFVQSWFWMFAFFNVCCLVVVTPPPGALGVFKDASLIQCADEVYYARAKLLETIEMNSADCYLQPKAIFFCSAGHKCQRFSIEAVYNFFFKW